MADTVQFRTTTMFPIRRRIASSSVARNNTRSPDASPITFIPDGSRSYMFDATPGSADTLTRSRAKLQLPVMGKADSDATLCEKLDSSAPAPPKTLSSRRQTHSLAEYSCEVYTLKNNRGKEWTTFKWCLVWSVFSVFAYGTAAMVCALLTWFRTWNLAAVMLIADNDVLILITIAGSIVMSTALIGTIGTMLNSRRILAVYAVLLWPALIAIFVVGRISYRRSTFALDLKLNFSWSRYYTPLGRLVIQNSLQCCGYYTPLHEATPSETCNANAILPGCKWSLYNFEKENLNLIWSVALSLVPLHTVNIIIALLCVNHITITSTLAGRQSNGYTDYVQALLHDVNHLRKPAISRASSGGKFREDRIA